MKNKNSQTITNEFSNILTTSKRSPVKIESDRGEGWYNSIFENLLKTKNIQHFSRFTDKGHSIAERVIGTTYILLRKPVFEKRNTDWLSELPSGIIKYNNTIQRSIKRTPNRASKKTYEKLVSSNLQDDRKKTKTKIQTRRLGSNS